MAMIRAPVGASVQRASAPRPTRHSSRFRLSLKVQRALQGYMFILPWLVGFCVFLLWPLVKSFTLSFHELEAININDVKWVGFDNYRQAFFVDAQFVPILTEQIKQTFINTPAILIFPSSCPCWPTRGCAASPSSAASSSCRW